MHLSSVYIPFVFELALDELTQFTPATPITQGLLQGLIEDPRPQVYLTLTTPIRNPRRYPRAIKPIGEQRDEMTNRAT